MIKTRMILEEDSQQNWLDNLWSNEELLLIKLISELLSMEEVSLLTLKLNLLHLSLLKEDSIMVHGRLEILTITILKILILSLMSIMIILLKLLLFLTIRIKGLLLTKTLGPSVLRSKLLKLILIKEFFHGNYQETLMISNLLSQ